MNDPYPIKYLEDATDPSEAIISQRNLENDKNDQRVSREDKICHMDESPTRKMPCHLKSTSQMPPLRPILQCHNPNYVTSKPTNNHAKRAYHNLTITTKHNTSRP